MRRKRDRDTVEPASIEAIGIDIIHDVLPCAGWLLNLSNERSRRTGSASAIELEGFFQVEVEPRGFGKREIAVGVVDVTRSVPSAARRICPGEQ